MIIADDRERGSGVIEYLRSMGISVNIDRLEVGDYIISKEICIERKTVNDLINSIIDKRLFEQSRHLVLAFEKVYLIVEGDIDYTLRYRKIDLRQIYGALASVSELGIRLMFTKDPRQTATFLYVLHKRMKKSVRRYLPPTKIKVMKDSKSLPLVQLNLIASLPGISVELAEKILRHFKTPRKFFRASSFELKSVEGLGDKRVKKILEVLDTMYQPTVDKQLRES
ncbi:MAG: hypothetical protein DRJ41_00835 [Thermoprotei archaeon]|nr:MAG: hypothetical protein DRJ41_00835 [Thermoprotei archaeon]